MGCPNAIQIQMAKKKERMNFREETKEGRESKEGRELCYIRENRLDDRKRRDEKGESGCVSGFWFPMKMAHATCPVHGTPCASVAPSEELLPGGAGTVARGDFAPS